MKPNDQPELEVLRGIVVPTVWSAAGEPRLVAILTPDEGEFDVAPSAAGPELLSYLREEIEARILVKEGQKAKKSITVVSFVVVDALGLDDDVADRATNNNEEEPGGTARRPFGRLR